MSDPSDAEAQHLLDAYLDTLHAGRAPDRADLLRRRPDLESALDCLEALERLSAPDPDGPPTLAVGPGGADESHPSAAGPGSRVGKYELRRERGRGGMGVVFLAHDTELNRPVAVKMIVAGSLAGGELVRRFRVEARTLARLEHPQIVRVYDAGTFHGLPFLAMQFIDGPSLSEWLKENRPDAESSARLVAAVARAVAHLHRQDVVHRDLKPGNILLSFSGGPEASGGVDPRRDKPGGSRLNEAVPYVTDFGLAKLLTDDERATLSGAVVGTPGYMAPEQAAGKKEVGPAADVYALGAILYELLTGRPPFVGETALDTLLQVLDREPDPPRRLRPDVPEDLERVCLKCLEKAPERRFATAAEMADALEQFLKGEEVSGVRPTLAQRLRRWVWRQPALAARLAVLLVSVVLLQAQMPWIQDDRVRLIYWQVKGVLVLWVALAAVFQWLLRRPEWEEAIPYVWSAIDVLILSATLVLVNGVVSPLDIGFPLLIAASGLWFRERLVWFTAGFCAVAYLGLTAYVLAADKDTVAVRHPIFLAGLGVMGYIVSHQVRRVRTLSRYYEGRG
jgi:eukaryotic-like serine/threonine-protein kinase